MMIVGVVTDSVELYKFVCQNNNFVFKVSKPQKKKKKNGYGPKIKMSDSGLSCLSCLSYNLDFNCEFLLSAKTFKLYNSTDGREITVLPLFLPSPLAVSQT